jgi:hypothetical protein
MAPEWQRWLSRGQQEDKSLDWAAHGKRTGYTTGEAFAEVLNLRHNGRALGNRPVRLLVTLAGVQQQPYIKRTEPPADEPRRAE